LPSENLSSLIEKFDRVVLFIDEAFPEKNSTLEDGKRGKRLRFIRNVGRLMRMRVVLAGTAATATNMIPEKYVPPSVSRTEVPECAWAEIMFSWIQMEETVLKKLVPVSLLDKMSLVNSLDLQDAIGKERPLLAVLFKNILERNSEGGKITLINVIQVIKWELQKRKRLSREKHVLWLAGPWLDGDQRMSSSFRIQASELVRDHFFEPAMARYTHSRKPILGPTFDKIERRSSPLRLGINTSFDHYAKVHFFSLRATG